MTSKKMYGFVKMPTDWVLQPAVITSFSGSEAVTLLKTYYGLLILKGQLEFHARRSCINFVASLDDVAEAGSIGRSAGMSAAKVLADRGLVTRDFITRPTDRKSMISCYSLPLSPAGTGWGPFPWRQVESGRFLRSIHQRTGVTLAALKLFLLLVALRENRSGYSRVTYPKITQRLGIERRHIRAALSLLMESELLHMDSRERREDSNLYFVRGLGGSPQQAFDLDAFASAPASGTSALATQP
ncbi:MAG: hypothetical protein IT381_11640 [Deltaproteobacteria bacterium]|nr:hypothetical protein [Deltaproteobacteria bacterium]